MSTRVTMNGIAAPITAVAYVNGREQINFQVPWELAGTARATMVVHGNGGQSAGLEVPLMTVQPEIFAITRGEGYLTVWATGLGDVTGRGSRGACSASRAQATRGQ